MSSASHAVELTGIARRFGARWVLKGASLSVAKGETVAILGKNGSGKTTLLRIIATLLRASRGTGAVFGHDLARDPDAVRTHVGLLGHSNGIYPDLTAAENLGFALRMMGRSVDPKAIGTALDQVGLASHASHRTRGFSAGMQRRLAIARLRTLDADLLLLDEPYSSLDPEGTELVTSLMSDNARRSGAAILVTHDIGRAQRTADRIVALDDGCIISWAPGQPVDVE